MKYLIDVLASTVESGGMKLHATEMIRAWMEDFPEDDLVIHGPEWIRKEFSVYNCTLEISQNENAVFRSYNQLFRTARLARKHATDAVISFSPIVTPFVGKRQSVAFQHDWRHKLNPQEFPLTQRLYRKLWEISAKFADINACISEKAELETLRFVSGSQTFLCPNGRDHARFWDVDNIERFQGMVVTYGHHNNKRPELVISAFGLLRSSGNMPPGMRLTVLGAKNDYRRTLVALAEAHNVFDYVDFPGFVSAEEYVAIMTGSSVVVLVSTDEGFGLPIAEAEYLRIPAVISSDSGMAQIFGDAAIAVDPNAHDISKGILSVWNDSPVNDDATDREPLWRWGDAVRELRRRLDGCHV
ncbi:glycosyltransferase involved in cell wall biosynthesis [Arthrobacter sp. UYCu511]